MTHNREYCPKYQDKVLPNEGGNCSLCGAKLTDEACTTCDLCGNDIPESQKICTCQTGEKNYRVGMCYEVGAFTFIRANSIEEAEEKVHQIMEYSGLDKITHDVVHREYWTQDAEESK